jgi:hypothetical protein
MSLLAARSVGDEPLVYYLPAVLVMNRKFINCPQCWLSKKSSAYDDV